MHCICNVGGVRLQPFLRSMKCRLSYVLAGNNLSRTASQFATQNGIFAVYIFI